MLPRLPSQSELVPLKLKRKLTYRRHYLYEYATPQKLLEALKANNPLYVDIDINEEWLEQAIANDAELCDCLVEQQNDSDVQTDSPNVASQSSVANVVCHNVPNMDNAIAIECSDNEDALSSCTYKLETIASQNGFTIHDVPYDGNCICSVLLHIS